jgi:glycosyltransferase involved in cell wall biosynthesis
VAADDSEGCAQLRLAVVIPTLNEEANLGALLDRLLGEGADLVVVADGGSRDATQRIAAEAGALLVKCPRGRGPQLARGAEVALAEGAQLLWFLHADNLPSKGCISALRAAASAASQGKAGPQAWGCRQRVDAAGRFYRMVGRKADQRVTRGLVYGDSGLFVTAPAYRQAGGYRPIPVFEDLDLSRRLAGLGPIELVADVEIVVHTRRWKREGALRTTVRNWMLTRAWQWGVAPEHLARFYPAHKSDKES